jgi:hypothetical protein
MNLRTKFGTKPWLLAPLVVVFAVPWLPAQDASSIVQTNEVIQTDASDSNDDLGATDELGSTNQVGESNALGKASAPGPDARTRRLQRLKRNRPNSSPANGTELSRGTNGFGPLDYAAFRLITERNIFDPNRQPHKGGERPPSKAQDSFSLVGTMSYDKGDFAFFDGNSSDYKKVLKPDETIAGYKVVSISADSVKLERESKDLELPVGSQLRRQDDGTWVQSAHTDTYAASSSSSGSSQTDAAPGGGDNDVLKRLMQRREKENSP